MPIKTINLEKLAAETEGLPVITSLTERVIEYLNQPDTTVAELTKVIERDPTLVSRLLKVVNSPFFGFRRDIYTVHQAVVSLGFNTIKHIIIALSILDASDLPDFPLNLRRFAADAFTSGVASKILVSHFESNLEEPAFIMGLIMNLGQPLFALHFPDVYRELIDKAHSSYRSLNELERQTFLWDHARLGSMLVKRWGFPDSIILPIFYHHNPNPPIDKSNKDWILIPIAYLANNILEVFRSQAKKESLDFCLTEAKRLLDLSDDTLHQTLENISVKGKDIAQSFDFSLSETFSYSKVLHSITVQLGEMNLTYEQMVKELRQAKVEAEKLAHQLKIANEELSKRADRDGLTGIFNHRYFQEHLAVEFMRAVRYGSPLALVLFDIDFFKKVNDEHGHIAGDEVLMELAGILKKNTRISDFVSRYGGEEFVIVLPETTIDNAYLVAEKIRNKIENYLFRKESVPLRLTISGGVASVEPGKKLETANELIASADKKLYRAKRGGRNQVVK